MISFFVSFLLIFYGLIFKFGSILLRDLVDEFITNIVIPEYEKQKQKEESDEESAVIRLVWRAW
jgi:peptidoglycan biosynthesis protein MviN/MurJ (putative lipid II flippase)